MFLRLRVASLKTNATNVHARRVSVNYFRIIETFYFCHFFIEFETSKAERMMMTIGEVIQGLLNAHEENRDVDLNKLKTRISSKYGLATSPRLVDIIAAVPVDVKHILLPKLKAKPIRTASGVSF